MAMTLCQSRSHQIYPDHKKRNKYAQVSRQCWLLFLMLVGWFTGSLFIQDTQYISSFTWVNIQYGSICLQMFRLFSDILHWLKRQNLWLVIQILNEILGLAPTINTTFFCKINILLLLHNFQLCTHLIKRFLLTEVVTNCWTKNCIHPKFNAYYELLI